MAHSTLTPVESHPDRPESALPPEQREGSRGTTQAKRPMSRAPDTDAVTGDDLGHPTSRRWLALLALCALLLFAVVGGALAWRQYRDEQRAALHEARTRAVIAAAVFDAYFAGQIGTLSSIAKAPPVLAGDEAGMLAYFKRVQPKNGKLFTGGLGWVDREGIARVSTNRPEPGRLADVGDRSYFKAAMKTGGPFVSEGLTGRQTQVPVIVTAVPTRDAAGQPTGVLIGTVLIKPTAPDANSLDLGYAGLVIIDRQNQSVLAGFAHPRSLAGPKQFGSAANGVRSNTTGLDGDSGHVLAFARAKVPQWTVILDRSRSELFAGARRNLLIEAALIAGMSLVGLLLFVWILRRMRTEADAQRAQARSRRLRYEEEHRVATTLQRSLLADVPKIDSIDAAARYEAGSTGLEVGGDWYDVLQRPDGIVHVTMGDVAGRGVAAAALMGQLRNAFRAYAHDNSSPAEILWRLIRHMGEDELVTTVCITIDPYRREIAYASAGHPPALLRDDETGTVTRLDRAQAPPLGFVDPEAVREARTALPRRATLLAYTDGVIERRDRVIDEGIERLEKAFGSAGLELSAAELADLLIREVAEVTAADDDVALLVMRFADIGTTFELEPLTDPSALAELPEG